jgi:hypothetical protein
LLEFADVVHQTLEEDPLSLGDGFGENEWKTLQDLLGRYEAHLRQEAERAKRNRGRARKQALIALMVSVNEWTGDFQYQLLSELLCLFVDHKLTEENLRQYAHRGDVPKQMAARPKVPRRKKVTTGREAGRSPTRSKRWGQSKTDCRDDYD